jgi:hypothetical protein
MFGNNMSSKQILILPKNVSKIEIFREEMVRGKPIQVLSEFLQLSDKVHTSENFNFCSYEVKNKKSKFLITADQSTQFLEESQN